MLLVVLYQRFVGSFQPEVRRVDAGKFVEVIGQR